MDIAQIFKNNSEWVRSKLAIQPNYFEQLSKGQSPQLLYIGCSDSRVSAEELMGLEPGEAFIHRNIANLVPNTDMNVMSVLHFAITQLQVNHIVVCGHYFCGGVRAAMQSTDLGILNHWLRNIRDVYRTHQQELDAIEDETARYMRLVELNVQEQCVNVLKTAAVQKAYRNRGLSVHGWVFDVHSGKLIDLEIDFRKILDKIREIYHLD